MATKTFKIGLSNTDKQNMAQDVYERLIAMCFDEYDSTKTYNKGDFVVYENPSDTFKLYKCNSDNVTGAWDGSKWDLATFQDLVDDIESAVAFVNDKANVDGNYPTMTVGVADQLSPYDDESGDDQDEPFIFQATGTGNGTQPDFATGAIALMKEKQGNTVVVNQLVQNPNFDTVYSWQVGNASYGSFSISDGIGKWTCTTQPAHYYQTGMIGSSNYMSIPYNHKILAIAMVRTSVQADISIYGMIGGGHTYSYIQREVPANTWTTIIGFISNRPSADVVITSPKVCYTGGMESRIVVGTTLECDYCYFIDLTQWFNGNIPQDLLDNPSNFFRYYQGSLAYNAGELINANGRYIKCIGMNQWDEEWEIGSIANADGTNQSNSQTIRSKNYIRVNPNTEYYFKAPNYNIVYLYGANKEYLGYMSWGYNQHKVVPANACYIRFVMSSDYGTTYNNDISINLYYEKSEGVPEPRCLTYEPYEVLTNNDTGTETLRSAGSVKDYKTPDGTIHRLVGVVDLSQVSSSYLIYNSGFNSWQVFLGDLGLPKGKFNGNYDISNMISSTGRSATYYYGDKSNSMTIRDNGNLLVGNGSSTTPPTDIIYYEIAEETTEQGTPYSENLVIDDFGSMDFSGTNGVPQGNLIFYPVDYKAFIDTLYNYTEGTPSELALKSDLTGLVAQEDLSDGVTDIAGLTYSKKKAIKTGNLVTLTIVATNNTASAIPSNTTLFQLSNSLTPSVALYPIVLVHSTIAYSTINDANGNVSVNAELGTGKAVYINICYCL